jgi:hypothetical protein
LYNEEFRRAWPEILTWEDDLALLNHTHYELLLPLQRKRAELEAKEEKERKEREAQFPRTKEDFYTKSQDVQERVVKFLCLASNKDTVAQERMMSQYNWAWRQVEPLVKVFNEDVGALRLILILKQIHLPSL